MDRIERLSLQLLSSRRVAQPIDNDDRPRRDDIRPPMTDVDVGRFNDYPDDHHEEGENRDNILFGGPEEEFIPPSDDEQEVGRDTLRKSRIKLLAGMIWAQLGEPDAVVEESAPNELSVRVQDLSWKIAIDDDGRVNISGFDSGAEQYIGEIPEEDAEQQIVKIADHVHELISRDIEEKSTPAEPPVHFGPDDSSMDQGGSADQAAPPPAAPGGDQGVVPQDQAIPPDMGMGAPPTPDMGMPPAQAPGMGAPPGMAPPAAPGAFPPAGMAPGFPTASRRRVLPLRPAVRREAHSRLDEVSTQLYNIGEALGEEGEETFKKLADRVQRVVEVINQSNP
jgi:hypothetical protein